MSIILGFLAPEAIDTSGAGIFSNSNNGKNENRKKDA